MRRAAATAVALALALAGCGQARDFSGEPEVPKGYETYTGQGVSFAHPKFPQSADDKRLRFGDDKAFVELRVATGEATSAREFDSYVDGYAVLAEHAGDSEIVVVEQDVPKAKAAALMRVKGPQGLQSNVLLVHRGDDVILLSAGTRDGAPASVDADAVIESFRLR